VTDSDDCTGAVIQKSEVRTEFAAVQLAAARFVGRIQQLPPRISAVKIDGERAYKRARAGEEFEIKAREVEVTEFCVTATDSPDLIAYRIQCSKGTYIRSLARDLGAALGCGACVETLRREASGRLHVSNATSLEQLSLKHLIPWQLMLPELRQVFLDDHAVNKLWAGSTLELGKVIQLLGKIEAGERIVYSSSLTKQAHGLLRLMPPSGIVLEANIVEPQVVQA
jgi:tRNA pseudouridine55 synthase